MPSLTNPNVPTSQKPKSARTLKQKRQHTQRLARHKANGTASPRTSQAIRKAAPVSNKKARKLQTKKLHARNRALEESIRAGEVAMKDVVAVDDQVDDDDDERKRKSDKKQKGAAAALDATGVDEEMVLDQVTE